jgi:hypothetical protein
MTERLRIDAAVVQVSKPQEWPDENESHETPSTDLLSCVEAIGMSGCNVVNIMSAASYKS